MKEEIIDIQQVLIFIKYNGEHALLFERWAEKKDRDKITDHQFEMIEDFVSGTIMLKSRKFSDELKVKEKSKVKKIKPFFSEDALTEITKYIEQELSPKKKTSWLDTLLGRL